ELSHAFMLVIVRMADGDDAAMRDLADTVFKLNGGMKNVELGGQQVFHAPKNRVTLRRGDVGDLDMAGKRVSFRAEAPYMHVVDAIYTFKRADHGNNFSRRYAVGS